MKTRINFMAFSMLNYIRLFKLVRKTANFSGKRKLKISAKRTLAGADQGG
jgi:hypothetical protein